jgi:hypothetical protein
MLLQINKENNKQPISFMSQNIRDVELNYMITEKQAYSLVQSLKQFISYVGYNKIITFVSYLAIKDVLAQQDCLGVRGEWVSNIQEYDMEIKPTKIIKWQGLAKI